MKKEPVFLIDAYGLIYRAYFAFIRNPLRTRDGRNTSAIFGFFKMLFRFIREYSPVYCGIILDSKTPTFREQIFAQYKATRQKTPEDLHAQIPLIEDILAEMGFSCVRLDGYEADDIMGTLSVRAEEAGHDCYVVSSDKDLAQLVTRGVRIIRMEKDNFRLMDSDAVKEKWGVSPEQIIDYLALVGDVSDNIPGVEGIGEKGAARLLSLYRDMDDIYAHLDEMSPSIEKKLSQGKERAYLSRELATIKTDVDIDVGIEDLKIGKGRPDRVEALFESHELKSLILDYRELFGVSSGTDKADKETASLISNEEDVRGSYVSVISGVEFDTLCEKIKSVSLLALDTETDSADPFSANIVGISFAFSPGDAYYLPIVSPDTDCLDNSFVLAGLRKAFSSCDALIIGQNIKFDLHVLRRWGLDLSGPFFDTMVAAWVLDAESGNFGMDFLAERYLGWKTLHYTDVVEKGSDFSSVPLDIATSYAAEDADVTFRLYEVLEKELLKEGLVDIFYDIEMPILKLLTDMESRGIRLDADSLRKFSVELDEKLKDIEKTIYACAGHEFNINSTKQLQIVLFEERGLTPTKKTKTGYSTDISVLEELAGIDELPRLILEYRSLFKLKNTYVDVLPSLINPVTGRIHTWYGQTGTATGRISSKDPNLQNIPIKTEEGRRIREAFVPDDGFVFISADYSQIELVILAHLSQDQGLCRSFIDGEDVHRATASLLFSVPVEEVSVEQRRIAKSINFGVMYGMSAFRLARELGIPRKDAADFISAYFEKYSGIKAFIEKVIREAEEQGYSQTIMGRRRRIPYINSKNKTQKMAAERMAVNTAIQGSGADIIKKAMIEIEKLLKEKGLSARMLLQVHDELVFEVPEEECDVTMRAIKSCMESVVKLSVPLRVNVESGKNWGQMH
ncbi:DNA polymerase I [Spirochaetia bacterium 38H-sp]|uniref:DNA polymerase I n=1 Tax=Rarispira pelagica TaxID=3141764 RepID=A0ABU9U9T3_9SPIR